MSATPVEKAAQQELLSGVTVCLSCIDLTTLRNKRVTKLAAKMKVNLLHAVTWQPAEL